MLVLTPEKWDVVTRKSVDSPLVKTVRLLIIDEIHLLHDDRGPVIETIVARTLRQVCTCSTYFFFNVENMQLLIARVTLKEFR